MRYWNWTTQGEANVFEFYIQRSVDGLHFTTIGIVAASPGMDSYTYTDKNSQQISAPSCITGWQQEKAVMLVKAM